MKKIFLWTDQVSISWISGVLYFEDRKGNDRFSKSLRLIALLKFYKWNGERGFGTWSAVENATRVQVLSRELGINIYLPVFVGFINPFAIDLILATFSVSQRFAFDAIVEESIAIYSLGLDLIEIVEGEEGDNNIIKERSIYKNINIIGNNTINRNRSSNINNNNNNILFNARVNNTFKAKDYANFSTTSVDRNKNKNKNIDIESYKLFIDNKFRSEELLSLFNFLDEFNVGSEDRKRLEDLILIVGQLLSISKLGITKKGVIELKGKVLDLFDSIGFKSEILYNILKYIDKVSEECSKSRLINYTTKNIKSKLVKEYNNNNKNTVEKYMINDNEEFLLKLIEIAARRKVVLSDSKLQDIIEILNLLGSYNYHDNYITRIIEGLRNKLMAMIDFNDIISQVKKESYRKRKRKLIVKTMTIDNYTKELDSNLDAFLIKVKEISVNYFMDKYKNLIELLPDNLINIIVYLM